MEVGINPLNCAPLDTRGWETRFSNLRDTVYQDDTIVDMRIFPGKFINFNVLNVFWIFTIELQDDIFVSCALSASDRLKFFN